jgi:hypothetical protein
MGLSDTYAKLKASVLKSGCIIVAEEVPIQLSIVQGSIWGVSSKAAKKNIEFHLSENGSQTRVLGISIWTPGYKMLTLVGRVLAAVLLLVCFWIFLSITNYVSTLKTNYWSWLASSNGFIDLQKAQLFIGLSEVLAIFLIVSLSIEAIIVAVALKRIDSFARERLEELT